MHLTHFLAGLQVLRKVAGHVVLTGQLGFPVDVLLNALLKALSQTSILAMVW